MGLPPLFGPLRRLPFCLVLIFPALAHVSVSHFTLLPVSVNFLSAEDFVCLISCFRLYFSGVVLYVFWELLDLELERNKIEIYQI